MLARKTLYVISDMIEYTRDYSQYPRAGDLSFQRYKQSPAYLKFRTDLHGATVIIRYVTRLVKGGVNARQWIAEGNSATTLFVRSRYRKAVYRFPTRAVHPGHDPGTVAGHCPS